MPPRSLDFHQTDSSSSIINTPRVVVKTSHSVFDDAFNDGLGIEQWDDWMRWEGATTELLPASIETGESADSSVSSPNTWTICHDISLVDMMSASYAAGTDYPFVVAPFEVEDTPPTSVSSSSIQHDTSPYPATTSYPTQGQIQQELHRCYRGFSSLTEAEERSLQDIAMPYHVLSNIKIASTPTSPTGSQASQSLSPFPEPEVRTRKNNKCKSVDLGEQPGSALYQSRKRGHNAIEKRYRTNLTAKIESLREGVPSLCGPNDNAGEEDSDVKGDKKSNKQKHGKAAILMRALEYIQHLEKTTQRLGSEVDSFKTRVGAFEKLAMSGSIILNGSGMEAIIRPVLTKAETLQTVQSDQQIQPKPKAVTGPATKR